MGQSCRIVLGNAGGLAGRRDALDQPADLGEGLRLCRAARETHVGREVGWSKETASTYASRHSFA